MDFGLATLSSPADADDEPSDRNGMIREAFVGTRGYAPPEALRGVPSSPNGDRWALAVIIVEAAEELREDELAVVVDAAERAHRRVIIRLMADA